MSIILLRDNANLKVWSKSRWTVWLLLCYHTKIYTTPVHHPTVEQQVVECNIKRLSPLLSDTVHAASRMVDG